MPDCRSCGAFVTPAYIRVFSRDGQGVDACPSCPDMVREGGQVRAAHGDRTNARQVREGVGDD